ncbi:MAG: hypothetical protein E7235_06060 [Lachnospiraceae bacterium]|nr:hypothetical protein [Lachnospiraceae bacterium]
MKRLESENLIIEDYIDDINTLAFRIKADDDSENEVRTNFVKLGNGLCGSISVESDNEDNEELLFNEMIKKLMQYKNEETDHNSKRFFTGWITMRYASE